MSRPEPGPGPAVLTATPCCCPSLWWHLLGRCDHADAMRRTLFSTVPADPRRYYGVSAMSEVDRAFARLRALIAGQPDPGGHGGTAGLLRRVCEAAVQTLSASGAGVTVMTDDGGRGVGAASDPASERLEELQLTLGEGSCIDAYASRRPVLVPDAATPAGHRRDERVRRHQGWRLRGHGRDGHAGAGGRGVHRADPGTGHPPRYGPLRAAAGSVGQPGRDRTGQGAVAQARGVSVDDAFASIRSYARRNNRRLTDVAHSIVATPITAEQLL